MIISRREFHRRHEGFSPTREYADERRSVEMLFKETQADAYCRNHTYLFDGSDLSVLELQEPTVGITKAFPDIKTEAERMAAVEKEVKDDTYEAVPISVDVDYPDVFYIEDGFHRILAAYNLGLKVMRVKARYGKFILANSISFRQLADLLKMMERLFPNEIDVKKLRELLDNLVKKKPDAADSHSIVYGYDNQAK